MLGPTLPRHMLTSKPLLVRPGDSHMRENQPFKRKISKGVIVKLDWKDHTGPGRTVNLVVNSGVLGSSCAGTQVRPDH